MTRVTQLIHDAGKYLLISVYPLPTHPTHNFTHNNGGNLETLPGWPKKLQHNRPARSAGQQRASAKLENSFVTANFASAWAQLSKLERQRALLQNCGQIINKQQLFIFPNSLTIHQTPPLLNTFYFSNTWTKIQLRSDPVNMQPDETKCYPQRPITTLWPAACKMLSTSSGSPPLNSGTLSLHMERNCRIRRGAAGYWNVTLATTRRQALSCCSQANIRRRTGKMWWLIEICINWVVHWSFDGYHEWSGD